MSRKPDGGRWELKYVLPVSARAELLRIAGPYIIADPHGKPLPELGTRGYDVHSMYFDTPRLTDYTERLESRNIRVRLRIRTYGQPGDHAPVFFEDKRKFDAWVMKQRCKVADADHWLALHDPQPWVHFGRLVTGQKALVARHFLRRVEEEGRVPVSVVHYRRECFTDLDPAGSEVRLTMDHHISSTTSPRPDDFYAPPDQLLIPEDFMVLELKFNRTEPGWMRTLVRELRLQAEPVSKFALSVAYGLRSHRPAELRRVTPVTILRAREGERAAKQAAS